MFPPAATVITIPPYTDPVVVNRTTFIPCKASYDINLDLIYMWTFNGKLIDFEKEFHYRLVSFPYTCIYNVLLNTWQCKPNHQEYILYAQRKLPHFINAILM